MKCTNRPKGNMYAPNGPTVYQASDDAIFPASPKLMQGDKVYERSKVSAMAVDGSKTDGCSLNTKGSL